MSAITNAVWSKALTSSNRRPDSAISALIGHQDARVDPVVEVRRLQRLRRPRPGRTRPSPVRHRRPRSSVDRVRARTPRSEIVAQLDQRVHVDLVARRRRPPRGRSTRPGCVLLGHEEVHERVVERERRQSPERVPARPTGPGGSTSISAASGVVRHVGAVGEQPDRAQGGDALDQASRPVDGGSGSSSQAALRDAGRSRDIDPGRAEPGDVRRSRSSPRRHPARREHAAPPRTTHDGQEGRAPGHDRARRHGRRGRASSASASRSGPVGHGATQAPDRRDHDDQPGRRELRRPVERGERVATSVTPAASSSGIRARRPRPADSADRRNRRRACRRSGRRRSRRGSRCRRRRTAPSRPSSRSAAVRPVTTPRTRR